MSRLARVPARRRGLEILDDPLVPASLRERSLRDVARSNVVFGGLRAAVAELDAAVDALARAGSHPAVTLLDVGTGLADIPARARTAAARRGVPLRIVGLDAASSLLRAAATRLDDRVAGDALTLPFADRSVDVVLASQVMHHFDEGGAVALVREMNRVARHRVVIADLRRSWFAAAGFWLASWPLRFHPITRHDGVMSVLRGFTADELEHIVQAACGARPQARHHLGFRLTVSWSPP